MARHLAVEEDALAREVLVDVLRDGSVSGEGPRRGGEGPGRGRDSVFAALVSDERWPELDGLELARRVGILEDEPSIAGEPVPVPARDAVATSGGGTIAAAAPAPTGTAAPAPPVRPAEAAAAWEGAAFLARVDGPLDQFPPARVLFLAHRVAATGQLELAHGPLHAALGVRGGRIVHVEGVADLFAGLPVVLPDRVDLLTGMGRLVAEGVPVEDAARVASESLGSFLVALAREQGGHARWTARTTFPPAAYALPLTVPRMLAAGLRAQRGAAALRKAWGEREEAQLVLQLPGDAADDRLGLDMTALRLIRLAPRTPAVAALVAAVAGTGADRRTDDVLRSLDLLELLGLVRVEEAAVVHVAPRPRPAPARPVERDPRAEELRQELARVSPLHPVEALGLADLKVVALPAVEKAFRRLSAAAHPDAFRDAPAETREVALSLFAVYRAALDALSRPGGIEDAQKFVDARAKGLPYVSETMEREARVAFRKGEALLRGREYRLADPLLETAARLDPLTWPHVLYAARTGYLTRRLSGAEALARIDGVTARRVRDEAERLAIKGEILKLEGKLDAAVLAWKQALQKDAACHEATRELRLHERRSREVTSSGERKGLGGLLGALGRK